MADVEWTRIAIEVLGWAASSLIGLFIGAWRAGRRSAEHDQSVKDDYEGQVDELREETRKSMAAYEQKATSRNDLLIEQFKESFEGIRRQIDQNKLAAEMRFLAKNDFSEWRKEYREDIRDLKESIADIAAKH